MMGRITPFPFCCGAALLLVESVDEAAGVVSVVCVVGFDAVVSVALVEAGESSTGDVVLVFAAVSVGTEELVLVIGSALTRVAGAAAGGGATAGLDFSATRAEGVAAGAVVVLVAGFGSETTCEVVVVGGSLRRGSAGFTFASATRVAG